ncbi:hypothetical protein [Shimia sp. SDUM112013]|uniref:hypothetical protein n=1 Tax=Shimia sp. SDUM112013 TaxID=3136160 RepID=UPI0032EAF047
MRQFRKSAMAIGVLTASSLFLASCDDASVYGGASVGVYYDSMMWNDYYRPYPPPSHGRPPAKPVPPIAKPPGRPVHPIAPAPPIHRPAPRPR